jgi:hypothetical protein
MKVELVEEQKYNGEPWYIIRIDGDYLIGTGVKTNAERMYNEIVADPTVLKTKRNILKSQEVDVPLEEQNN